MPQLDAQFFKLFDVFLQYVVVFVYVDFPV